MKIIRNEDYSVRVGLKKGTNTLAATAGVGSVALLFIHILRYNDLSLWPVADDDLAVAAIMTFSAGLPRMFEDWYRKNILDVRYKEGRQDNRGREPQENNDGGN